MNEAVSESTSKLSNSDGLTGDELAQVDPALKEAEEKLKKQKDESLQLELDEVQKLLETDPNKKVNGLSLSACVSHIAAGLIKPDQVAFIVSNTVLETEEDLTAAIIHYQQYEWSIEPEKAEQITRQLFKEGRIIQPKLLERTLLDRYHVRKHSIKFGPYVLPGNFEAWVIKNYSDQEEFQKPDQPKFTESIINQASPFLKPLLEGEQK